jgi:hypothetical protein
LNLNDKGDLMSASLEGSTKKQITRIENKPIRDLQIPRIIEVTWRGVVLSVRIIEAGDVFFPPQSQLVGREFWLSWSGIPISMDPTPTGVYYHYIGTDYHVERGRDKFIEIVGSLKLKDSAKPLEADKD